METVGGDLAGRSDKRDLTIKRERLYIRLSNPLYRPLVGLIDSQRVHFA